MENTQDTKSENDNDNEKKAYLCDDVQDFSSIGNLFHEPKPVKVRKEQKKKAKKVKAVEDMTAAKRAQRGAGKVANRLYGAKAKAPKYA